ncbi:hypothetical protein [Aestuariirhabdus sp. LZHN29]|uniref:hypothetical protein n=1 Tax=Aestuariirhabdus sp. LZHN29 TaxID=3417462 RepID=UPI003CF9F4C1
MNRLLNWLGSMRLTLLSLIAFGAGVGAILQFDSPPTPALALGFCLLLLNLVFAILVKEKIRSSIALLLFHIALLVLMLLVIASRATYMKGWVTLAEGEQFTGFAGIKSQGWFHPEDHSSLGFYQGPFSIYFGPDGGRTDATSEVYLPDQQQRLMVGSQKPLKVSGYRFTLSRNIGFSALVRWRDPSGEQLVALRFPSQITQPDGQAVDWPRPDGKGQIWMGLEVLDERRHFFEPEFRVPDNYQLILRLDDQRLILKPGENLNLKGAQLQLLGLERWIGYEVFYDWTMNWLLATCLFGILCLGWYLWQKTTSSRWNLDTKEGER